MKKPTFSKKILVAFLFLLSLQSFGQVLKTFAKRHDENLKGDILVIGNNILNRDYGTAGNRANDSYDALGSASVYNESIDLKWINVDPDGVNNFNSSSANLTIPAASKACYGIVYAGLYWSGTYTTANRSAITNVRLKTPTAGYKPLTGTVIYDYVGNSTANSARNPYACFVDITAEVKAAKEGTYTLANIACSEGGKGTSAGHSAGWSIFVIYEDPKLPGKYITSYDGFTRIKAGDPAFTFPINGFKTIPSGSVEAKFAFAALEGDNKDNGDAMTIKGNTIAGSTTGRLFCALRPASIGTPNFFNSTINDGDVYFLNRNPKSKNTFGYDTGVLKLPNSGNTVIQNNETGADITLTTSNDWYYLFFTALAVEVIEPKVVLTKKVINTAGDDITNKQVNRGEELRYVIGFENVGNDKAKNLIIEDYLPNIVLFTPPASSPLFATLNDVLPLPAGVTIQSYSPSVLDPHDGILKRKIVFAIDPSLVDLVNDQERFISFKVHVPVECKDFSDACSNEVKNVAYSKYTGEQNTGLFGSGSQPPSVACGLGDIATNFIGNIDDCTFASTYTLCLNSVAITARNGFQNYTWTGPNGFTATGKTINVTQIGDYVVKADPIAPCLKSLTQTIKVELYSNTETDALLKYAANLTPNGPVSDRGEIVQCAIDGKKIPHIFLCGAGDHRDMTITNAAVTSVEWYQLTGATCIADAAKDNGTCANESSSCSWTLLKTSLNYSANTAGYFKAIVRYGSCFNTLYFNVYKNDLNLTASSTNKICSKLGTMTVSGVPATGYEYSFNVTGYTGLKTYSSLPNANVFTTAVPQNYTASIRQIGVVDGCVFTVAAQIDLIDFKVDTKVTQPTCNDTNGSIQVIATAGSTNYVYTLSKNGVGTVATVGPVAATNNTFINQGPGTYSVNVKTADGCDVTVNNIVLNTVTPLTATVGITKSLTCADGEITVYPVGGTPVPGTPPYYYYFVNGSATFQTSPIIVVTTAGNYTVEVVDNVGCKVTTLPIKVDPILIDQHTVAQTNLKCYGDNIGTIKLNVANDNGYTLAYSIDNGGNYGPFSSFTGLAVGTYKTIVRYTLGTSVCYDAVRDVTITGPTTALTASGGVSAMAGCGGGASGFPKNYGKVRITNPQGGTPGSGYTYSFDGGNNYIASNEAYVAPGTYTLYIKDAVGCIYTMPGIILEDEPTAPTILVSDPLFNCNGSANSTVTVTNPNSATYSYNYYLNGTLNPNTADPKTFLNVPASVPGTPHVITVEYKLTSVPTYSNLLKEDFGSGGATTTPGINPAYCFEDQHFPNGNCNGGRDLVNNEYSVTNKIQIPWSGWVQNIKEHTNPLGDPAGRFLAIDIGSAAGPGGILYSKTIKDIIPNKDILVDFYAINLYQAVYSSKADPNLKIELVYDLGKPTQYIVPNSNPNSFNVPKTEVWNPYKVTLNPGSYTTLSFVIRSNSILYDGNDVGIDDIKVYQLPETCTTKVDFPFVVAAGKDFQSAIKTYTDVTCAGITPDGTITITAQNFKATGFEYTTDNWATFKTSTTSPLTISGLSGGTHKVQVRYEAAVGSCSFTFDQVIKSPQVIVTDANVTVVAKCSVGATIVASATGGTGAYEYQLTNDAGVAFSRPFQNNDTFLNIPPGNYIVTTRDANKCIAPVPFKIKVDAPAAVTASIVQNTDLCFDGSNAKITVNVGGGVGPYSYQTSTDNGVSYGGSSATFTGPSASFTYTATGTGTYRFKVTDSYGCFIETVDQVISGKLTARIDSTTELDCDVAPASPDAVITGKITGGTAPFVVSIPSGAATGTLVQPTDPAAANTRTFTYTIGTAGTYKFQIKDANSCITTVDATINSLVAITLGSTNVNPKCNGNLDGTIQLNPAGGSGGFTYSKDGITYNNTSFYSGLAAGTYTYYVKDSKNCTKKIDVTLTDPAIISGTASITTAYTCDGSGTITVGAVTGGNGVYKYTLTRNGVAVTGAQDSKIFNNISVAGKYEVLITDSNGCSFTTATTPALTIVALNPPLSPVFSERKISCKPLELESQVTVSVTAGTGKGTLKYEITAPAAATSNITGATDGVFTGLTAAATGTTYTFKVTDANNCSVSGSYTVNPVVPIVVTAALVSNVKCFGDTNGAVDYTISGLGNGVNYSYSIDGAAAVTGTTPAAPAITTFVVNSTVLAAGLHSLVITDTGSNCTGKNTPIKVDAPTKLVIDLPTITPITCSPNKGKVVINTTGGWGNNKYTLTLPDGTTVVGPQSSDTFSNLTQSGTYKISVTDLNGNGCTVTDTFTMDAKVIPSASIVAISDLCYDAIGKAKIVVEPIVVPPALPPTTYVYNINNGAYQASGTFPNLTPNVYTVNVKDTDTGCILPLTQTIANELTFNALLNKAADCKGQDIEIKGTISGGTVPYTYTVTKNTVIDPTVRTSPTTTFIYTDPTADTTISNAYLFILSDSSLPAPGCSLTSTVVVAPKTYPAFTATPNSTKILCNGDATGSITVVIDNTKGVSPYVINVVKDNSALPGPIANKDYFTQTTGLPAGTYIVTVTDANGCFTVEKDILITEPDKIEFIADIVPMKCTGGGVTSGSISVTLLKGGSKVADVGPPVVTDGPFTYTLTNNVGELTKVAPHAISDTRGDYKFDILNFGIYELTVSDANGCSVTKTITMASPPTDLVINVTAGAASCTSASLVVSVNPLFVGGPYHFARYPIVPGVGAPVPHSYPLNPVGTYKDADGGFPLQATFSGLNPGVTYSFIVYDETTKCYFFKQADAPTKTASVLTSEVTPANVTCQGAGNGKVSFKILTNDPSTTDVKYEIYNSQTNLPYAPAISSTIAIGIANTGYDIPNSLIPGTYYILFTELNAGVDVCMNSSETFTITQSVEPLILKASSTKNDNCGTDQGVIEAFGQGGTVIKKDLLATPPILNDVPYLYQVFPDTGALGMIDGPSDPVVSTAFAATFTVASHTSNTFNKEAGHYIVYVRDAYGCIQYEFVEVKLDPKPVITAVLDDACAAEGSFVIKVANTTGVGAMTPFSYSLDGGFYNAEAALSFSISNVSSGNHTVEVKDSNGCGMKVTLATIAAPLDIKASFTIQPKCKVADGTITAVVTGGSPAPALPVNHFEYTLKKNIVPATPDVVQNDNPEFITQSAGNYTVTVKDLNTNCTQSTTVDLLVPTDVDLVLADIDVTKVDCNAPQGTNNNGTITVNLRAVNDNPDYAYALSGTVSRLDQPSNVFKGLIPGSYDVTVTSGRGCPITVTGVIIAPPLDVTATATAAAFSCGAVDPTKTTAVVTGGGGTGTGTYTFSKDGTNYFATNSVPKDDKYTFDLGDTGLPQSPTYYVKDSNGCVQKVTLATLNPLPKLISATAKISAAAGSQIDCTVGGRELIQIDVVGGSLPSDFTSEVSIDGAAYTLLSATTTTPFTYSALIAGSNYQFRITDNITGCSILSNVYDVPLFDKIKVFANASKTVKCFGESNGAIEINITGYSGTYDYEILKGGASLVPALIGSGDSSITSSLLLPQGLAAGNDYTVKVIETAYPKCSGTSNVVIITEPAKALDISVVSNVNKNCNTTGAVVTVEGKFGTSGYTYVFLPSGGPVPNPATDYVDPATKTLNTLKISPAFDSWDVWVQDSRGCTDFTTIQITTDPTPTVSVNPYSQCPNLLTDDYTFTVVGAGVGPFEYSIGAGFQGDTFVVKAPGKYDVTVRDANKCTTTVIAAVTILDPLQLDYKITGTPICNGNQGEVTLTAKGGTVPASYEYSLDGTPYSSLPLANVFSGLAPRVTPYKFSVRDMVTGCTKEVEVTFEVPNAIIKFSLTPASVTCKGDSDGSITVNMDATTAMVNSNPIYTYAINPAPAGMVLVGNVFMNLPEGSYDVTVTSGKECKDTQTIGVGAPAPIMFAAAPVVTPYGCTAGTNGTNYAKITVSAPTGGSNAFPIYEFIRDLNPIPVQRGLETIYIETDLLGGSYTINVYDSKGCMGTTTATIDPFVKIDFSTPLGAITVKKAITCSNPEEIKVNVTMTGTTVPMPILDYNIIGVVGNVIPYPSQTNNTGDFTGLTVGNYIITVTNPTTGCSIQTVHYVNAPNTFGLKVDKIADVKCFGSNEGSVKLTLIDNQLVPKNDAGEFNYTIVDASGNPIPGGTSAIDATATLTNLKSGIYTVTATLTGTPYCEVKTNFTIDQPTETLAFDNVSQVDITCETGSKGSISVTAKGGWGGYEFQLELAGTPVSGYTWSSVSEFTGLSAGDYKVRVRDSKLCSNVLVDVKLLDPVQINVAISTLTPSVNCFGDQSATITVGTVTGGSGSYLYTLERTAPDGTITKNGPQQAKSFSNLGVGSYVVRVSDTWSCPGVSTPIVISEPTVVTASLVQATAQTCIDGATLTLSAAGGIGPYTYSTDPSFATEFGPFANSTLITVPFTKVTVNPIYYVKDSKGCVSYASNSVPVVPLELLSFEFENNAPRLNCLGDTNGQITVIAKGGSGNYVYTLLDSAGIQTIATLTQSTPANFTNLAAGSYMMDVKSGDCTVARKPITIGAPTSKLNYTPAVSNVTCNGDGNGKLEITANGGTPAIIYALSPELSKFVTTSNFTNLVPGDYTAIIQDLKGCNSVYPFRIKEPSPISAKVDPLTIKQEYCAGDLTGEFGIVIAINSGTAPYTTSLDNPKGPFANQLLFTGLKGGKHTVYVKDANLCVLELVVALDTPVVLDPIAIPTYDCVNDLPANKVTVTIDDSNNSADVLYSLDSSSTTQASNVFTNLVPGDHFIMAHHKNGCVDATSVFNVKQVDPVAVSIGLGGLNEIVATATGGSGVYRYTVNGEDIGSNNKYIYYKSGDYTVTVTDSNGCVAAVTKPFEFIDIIMPPIFTPTGDGTNDYWRPTNTENYPDIKFVVYDRYGRIVGTFGAGQFWDGKYNGTELPMGDYWYVLKLRNTKDDREFVGHFTLYR